MPPQLPVLHLSLHKRNPTLFAEQLRKACHEIGFFLLKHDNSKTCEVALERCREFFNREEKDKMSISYEHSPAFRGYMPMGVENTSGKLDFRQQIEYAAEYHEERGDERSLVYHRLRASNPWPDAIVPSFKPAIMAYVEAVFGIAGVSSLPVRQYRTEFLVDETSLLPSLYGSIAETGCGISVSAINCFRRRICRPVCLFGCLEFQTRDALKSLCGRASNLVDLSLL